MPFIIIFSKWDCPTWTKLIRMVIQLSPSSCCSLAPNQSLVEQFKLYVLVQSPNHQFTYLLIPIQPPLILMIHLYFWISQLLLWDRIGTCSTLTANSAIGRQFPFLNIVTLNLLCTEALLNRVLWHLRVTTVESYVCILHRRCEPIC